MKNDTWPVYAKCVCHVVAGAGAAWISSMGQWANSGEMPGHVAWIGVILPGALVGGANALLAFLSGSWSEYKKEMKNGKLAANTNEKTTP